MLSGGLGLVVLYKICPTPSLPYDILLGKLGVGQIFPSSKLPGRLGVTLSQLTYPANRFFSGIGFRAVTGHTPYKIHYKNKKCPKFSAEHAKGGPYSEGSRELLHIKGDPLH